MLSKEILSKLMQFIVTPACRVALRLKFYLWSYSLTCLRWDHRWRLVKLNFMDRTVSPLPAPSSECEYDFTVKTLLEDTIFSLNGIWYPYLTKQYAIFSISRTGSEFHVQLPFLYEGYSRYSVPLTGSSEEHTSRHVDRLCTPSTAFLSMRHNTACFVSSLPQV